MGQTEQRSEQRPRWRVAVSRRFSSDVLITILVANVHGSHSDAIFAAKGSLGQLGFDVRSFVNYDFTAERW